MVLVTRKLYAFIDEKRAFFKKAEKQGLESMISSQNKKLQKLDVDNQEHYKSIDQLRDNLSKSMTKCGVIRFNPFRGEGGDQSFSIAVLNDHNDGVVVSSLFSQNSGSRIYAKAIKNGESHIELTKEEREVILQAS